MNSAPSSFNPQISIPIDDSLTVTNDPIDVDALEITVIAASGIDHVEPIVNANPQGLESSATGLTPCPGIIVKMPAGKSVHSAYPFGLHDELGDP